MPARMDYFKVAPDLVNGMLQSHFSEREVVALTLFITTTNAWNRIAIGFRSPHPTDD